VIRGVDRGNDSALRNTEPSLIDEAHDFEPEWLKLVAQMVDPETNSLLVLYDDAQSINRPRSRLQFSFSAVGIQARGRTTVLKLNYRNTAEVMGVACDFAREFLSAKEADDDGIPLIVPQTAGRTRQRAAAAAASRMSAAKWSSSRRRPGSFTDAACRGEDMAVLFRMNSQGERIADALAKAGIPVRLFGSERRQAPLSLRRGHGKAPYLPQQQGLEFPVVFMPFLESMPHMRDDVAGEARLLYVAMTRAMEHLVLSHHGNSAFVGQLREAVRKVRGVKEETRISHPAVSGLASPAACYAVGANALFASARTRRCSPDVVQWQQPYSICSSAFGLPPGVRSKSVQTGSTVPKWRGSCPGSLARTEVRTPNAAGLFHQAIA
jgi:hypothetical protein